MQSHHHRDPGQVGGVHTPGRSRTLSILRLFWFLELERGGEQANAPCTPPTVSLQEKKVKCCVRPGFLCARQCDHVGPPSPPMLDTTRRGVGGCPSFLERLPSSHTSHLHPARARPTQRVCALHDDEDRRLLRASGPARRRAQHAATPQPRSEHRHAGALQRAMLYCSTLRHNRSTLLGK